MSLARATVDICAMNDRRALALLRAIVTGKGDTHALLAAEAPVLDRFVDFTDRHRLSGHLYRVLEARGLLGHLPLTARERARAFYLRQWEKNERLARELGKLGALFEERGLDVLVLKGPLFAERYYGNLDARAISDLDLLLGANAGLRDVERLLLGEGYVRRSRTLLGQRLSRRFTHHFEYRHGDIPVEVHWVLQQHFSFALDYPRLWRESEQVGFRGRRYRVLSPEYELVVHILALLTDLQVGKLTLKSFVDVYRILETAGSAIEWGAFFARRRQERILASSAHWLALLLDVLDCADQLPDLTRALTQLGRYPRQRGIGPADVLHSRRLDPGQKLSALRLYETSLAGALAWWVVSLPFRLAVYREERDKPLLAWPRYGRVGA
jgi:hypothetical protein